MPPRTRISREKTVDAAIEVIRRSGFENINARTVSDQLHTEYLMNIPPGQDPILGIGLNYIRFAVKEPQLFRFLFQSGYAEGNSLMEMVESEALDPVLAAMQAGSGLSLEKTREVFLTVALFAHGYASIIANNALQYDETEIAKRLERAWNGAILVAEREDR